MKRVGVIAREKVIDEIKENIQKSEGYFFLNFNKVKAFSISHLRNNLRTSGSKIYVTKNTLVRKAFQDSKIELNNLLTSETAIVFIYDKDIVKTCKSLADFAKENEILQIKGGFIKEKPVSTAELNALARLPPKEALLAQVLNGFASPLSGFISTLNQVILKFLWIIEEVKKHKETKDHPPRSGEVSPSAEKPKIEDQNSERKNKSDV
jgi:large subunit ribosomal protein L10